MAKAIQIFQSDEDGKYIFNQEALQSIFPKDVSEKRKIVIISITGPMRTGKSFILNYFLRYLKAEYVNHDASDWLGGDNDPLEGFKWCASFDSVTTGIWVWSEPFLCDDPSNGDKYAIILMDTQGLFEGMQTRFDHAAIFSLSSIMASTQIYNMWKDLNESNLEDVHQFSENGIATMKIEAGTPFQRLVLLIRDYDTPDLAPYGFEGGKKLLEHRMRGLSGPQVREFFNTVDCFLMRRLSVPEGVTFDGRRSMLQPEFACLLKIFVENILAPDNLKPKIFNDVPLDSSNFVDSFAAYAAFYKDGNVEGATVVQANITALNTLRSCLESYRELMELRKVNNPTLTSTHFKSIHKAVKQECLDNYDNKVKPESELADMYRRWLERDLEDIFVKLEKEIPNPKSFWEKLRELVYACCEAIREFYPKVGREIARVSQNMYETVIREELTLLLGKKVVEIIRNLLSSYAGRYYSKVLS